MDNNHWSSSSTHETNGDANNHSDKFILLPYDRFRNWIHCIALVTFDIELGQAIEKVYPSHVKLSEREKTNICYLSFPDSNSGCMGDTKFHFRTRLGPMARKSFTIYRDYNNECLSALQADACYTYGYVYFRQVKDRSARRGYFQKSLVILTRLPFVNLFSQIVSVIAPQYFDNEEDVLFTAINNIDLWPSPNPGRTLNLSLLGVHLQIHIPHKNDDFSCSPTSESSAKFPSPSSNFVINGSQPIISIPSLYEFNIFKCFLPIISHIQLLWELVLTCEPIIVMAPTPDICCEMVQSLVSMIWPLKYSSDFRPFFTIHDTEFKEYTQKSQSPPPVILGVTNPFFAKTLQHWPHIIRICEYSPPSPKRTPDAKIWKGKTIKTLECKPGLYTRYKPFLHKDQVVLKKLLKGLESRRPHEVQSTLMRRYFIELTSSFLIPLERYLASLMPLQKDISPFKSAPMIQPFNPDDFLKTLETAGPQLTTGIKGDWNSLYRKFFRTPNFSAWYESRFGEVSQKLKALHIESISKADLVKWIGDKAEIEIVDLILTMKDKLKTVDNENLPVDKDIVERVETQLNSIINCLPQDLHDILRK